MDAESKNKKLISKKNTGFPEYLDFDKLRTEGIDYLGRLSGKIWTDHNVHDPGITILEVLCYALLDLGYRTNLPEQDIFTRDPKDGSADNNFFTPGRILTCNPLTIIDFRKLLIDIEGVKNAWLEVATDEEDFCRPPQSLDVTGAPGNISNTNDCSDFLNGLYHVYIDLEKNVDKEFDNEAEKKEYVDEIIQKVKNALMAHRNLCEDFVDIYILCKQETGVCAEIEVEENAHPEKVYINVVENLRQFFSPSPQFYTLQQLLDRQKPIDEIFAGRPYNITQSHGFVDTEELEQLMLRKEIHLSDVYNVLFDTDGVKSVRNLRLQFCNKNQKPPSLNWKFHLPENHVPEFSMACSGLQFTRHDMPVFIDFKKFEGLFEINFTHNGKILNQSPSAYLDGEIPGGVYRSDLADYYSIQNEFPRVYGIAEGGLSESASPLRKAQAYQLKAYLLFFDQLLANYLAQLKNIRSLFAMSSIGADDDRTYFINQLTTVPDHQKLVRFNVNEDNINALGTEGSILVIPIDKKMLLNLKEQDKLKTIEIEKLQPYTFAYLADQDTIISQVKNDLLYEQYQCEYVTKTNDCVYFYILTSSDEIALISKKYFKSVQEATQNATSVKYIAGFDENYRSFITASNNFSFDIELNLLSFTKYLQLLIENKELFYQRRQGFLNHLLARFAEQFTDFAMLSFGFYNNHQLQVADIKSKERFLTSFDDLSSNRGKAYDYLENGWNNQNVSGFEKKFKAISGIENWRRHSLCNFVVDKYEEQYAVTLNIAGTPYFTAEEKFDSREDALSAAQSLFKALKEKSNYNAEYLKHEKAYDLTIHYAANRKAFFPERYANAEDALKTADSLSGLFSEKNPGENIFVSSFIYVPYLEDVTGKRIRRSVDSYPSDEEAKATSLKAINKINKPVKWELLEKEISPGRLYHDGKKSGGLSFIDTDAFKIDVDNTIIGKPEKFTYSVLDKANNFKFNSVNEFDDDRQARANAEDLLASLTEESNYVVYKDDASAKYLLHIVSDKNTQAVSTFQFDTEKELQEFQQKVFNIVKKQQYFISVDKMPHRWKFNYKLGYEKSNLHLFESINEYAKSEEASAAALLFYKAVPSLQLKEKKNELLLGPSNDNAKISAVKLIAEDIADIENKKEAVKKLLDEQKEITRLIENPAPETFNSSVAVDEVSRQGLYVYRLVDKDGIPAFYTKTFPDKISANAEAKNLANLFKNIPPYLRICRGGDIINKRKDVISNAYWYHYQLKSIDKVYTSGSPLIFFESTKGYQSTEEAEKAFLDNYLMLIHLASDSANYGSGKKISLAEILVHAKDSCIKDDSIVFVPKETLAEMGATPDDAVKEIVELMLTFPIRIARFKSKEFYDLFTCEKEEDEVISDDCKKEKEKWIYYFILSSPAPVTERWQSVKFYGSADEARRDFDIFLILLRYMGNYFADCDLCSDQGTYRVYLREVLAESAERFFTEEQAWGKDGVQKFICVSQTENGFHNYLRKNSCCYSFYVACDKSIVYHPCKYDTSKKRDAALLMLYRQLRESIQQKAYQIEDNDNTILLLDQNGKSFATIDRANRQSGCTSDWIAELVENLNDERNYKEEKGKIILRNDSNQVLVVSTNPGFSIAEWKEKLISFVCYYPIVKTKDEKTGRDQYCIEIKLPHFNTCEDDAIAEKPCGCGNEIVEQPNICYIAWKGRCCYTTCAEAEQVLQVTLKLLLNFNYYQPVFDCCCTGYSITLQFSKLDAIPDQNITYYWHEANISQWHSSEIVAINPQCYDSPEMACDAVSRAKKLINSEGLHLVEHILLRPHCKNEDCQCSEYSERCDNKTDCRFEWNDPDDDPCTDDKAICFVPGADRYSFIATVVLPAWPARFRKKENRQLLENILYREAPAQVLLRIQWLAPHDFCCFETKFKSWNRWLALKKTCIDNFNVCDFLEFLFDRNYECLAECDVCAPCGEDTQQPVPCFAESRFVQKEYDHLAQINELYCWTNQDCKKYEFIDCEEQRSGPIIENNILLARRLEATASPGETKEKETPIPREKPDEKKTEAPISESIKKARPGKEIISAEQPAQTTTKTKRQVVNSRMATYRTSVAVVYEKSHGNLLVGKVQSFLTDPEPSVDRLSKLAIEIIENKTPKTKEKKILTKIQVHELLQSAICYWLDKICFNGKDMKKLTGLKKIVEKLKKEKINVTAIYKHWNSEEVKSYEPDLDDVEIKKVLGTAEKK